MVGSRSAESRLGRPSMIGKVGFYSAAPADCFKMLKTFGDWSEGSAMVGWCSAVSQQNTRQPFGGHKIGDMGRIRTRDLLGVPTAPHDPTTFGLSVRNLTSTITHHSGNRQQRMCTHVQMRGTLAEEDIGLHAVISCPESALHNCVSPKGYRNGDGHHPTLCIAQETFLHLCEEFDDSILTP
ncbi:hypothetical protein Bbelb_187990 [Branchiostoma belcheri]|nr:hypothetical protein Bbelb_187990 [Branchiostoma belcheri]